nr:PH domain-containing protein [Rhodococcus rhodnii]
MTFPIFGNPAAFGWLILAPIVAAYAVARVRTVVTPEKITTRSMFRSDSIDWDDVTGFRFAERKPARAVLTDGTERVLPMVTFGRAPQLAAASGGRITDPYEAAVSAWREDEAAEEAAAAETDADENAATTGETTVDAEPAASRTPSRGDDPRE